MTDIWGSDQAILAPASATAFKTVAGRTPGANTTVVRCGPAGACDDQMPALSRVPEAATRALGASSG